MVPEKHDAENKAIHPLTWSYTTRFRVEGMGDMYPSNLCDLPIIIMLPFCLKYVYLALFI